MNRNAARSDQCLAAHAACGGHGMTFRAASTVIGLSMLATSGGLLSAQDSVPDRQQPPAEQQAPADQPQAEKSGDQPKCVTSNTAWREKGKSTTFEIELQNV